MPVDVPRSLAGRPAFWPRVIGMMSIRAVEAELALLVVSPGVVLRKARARSRSVRAVREDPMRLVMIPGGALGKARVMSWLPTRCGSVLFRFSPRASGFSEFVAA